MRKSFSICQSPLSKKEKSEISDCSNDTLEFVSTLIKVINTQSDKLESLIQENRAGIWDVKEKVQTICETRMNDTERHSRRWNRWLTGVPENIEDQGECAAVVGGAVPGCSDLIIT